MSIIAGLTEILSSTDKYGNINQAALIRELYNIASSGKVPSTVPRKKRVVTSSGRRLTSEERFLAEREQRRRENAALELEQLKSSLKNRYETAKIQLKHSHDLELEDAKTRNKMRFEAYKRLLTQDDRERANRSADILDRLREARRQDIIRKPVMRKFEHLLRLEEEAAKQRNRLELEKQRTSGAIQVEGIKQKYREQLAILKEKIKPRKETAYEQYSRLLKTGAIRTLGDIAAFFQSKRGMNKDALEAIVRSEASRLGVPDYNSPWLIGKKDAWLQYLRTPISVGGVDVDTQRSIVQFGDRQTAETAVFESLKQARDAGDDPEVIRQDATHMLNAINQIYGDQPSIFNTLMQQDAILNRQLTEQQIKEEYNRNIEEMERSLSPEAKGVIDFQRQYDIPTDKIMNSQAVKSRPDVEKELKEFMGVRAVPDALEAELSEDIKKWEKEQASKDKPNG